MFRLLICSQSTVNLSGFHTQTTGERYERMCTLSERKALNWIGKYGVPPIHITHIWRRRQQQQRRQLWSRALNRLILHLYIFDTVAGAAREVESYTQRRCVVVSFFSTHFYFSSYRIVCLKILTRVCVSAYFNSHLNLSCGAFGCCCRLSLLLPVHSDGFLCLRASSSIFVSCLALEIYTHGRRTWKERKRERERRRKTKNKICTINQSTRQWSKKKQRRKKPERIKIKSKIVCRYTLVFVLNRTTIRPY